MRTRFQEPLPDRYLPGFSTNVNPCLGAHGGMIDGAKISSPLGFTAGFLWDRLTKPTLNRGWELERQKESNKFPNKAILKILVATLKLHGPHNGYHYSA